MDSIRTRQILDYVKARKSCTLKELMQKFRISSATVHRDVVTLAARDAVERVRGGLVYKEAPRARGSNDAYQDRVVAHRTEKIAAARKALALIEEGDIIAIDIPNASINVQVSEEILAERRAAYVSPEPNIKSGWLARYAKLVSGADQGAIMKA